MRRLGVMLILSMILPSPVRSITLVFEGPINSVQTSTPALTTDLPIGQTVAVEFTFDVTAPEAESTVDDPEVGSYGAFDSAVVIFGDTGRTWEAVAGSDPVVGLGSQAMTVTNDQMFFQDDETFVSDTIIVGVLNSELPGTSGEAFGELGGFDLASVAIIFQDRDVSPETPQMLTDDSLPQGVFFPERVQITFSAADGEESGVFFLEPVAPVPEPAAMLALIVGASTLVVAQAARHRSPRAEPRSS